MGVGICIEGTIKEYLEGLLTREIVISRMNNIGKNTDITTGFTDKELNWLRHNFDKLPIILNSRLACRVYIAINSIRGAYLRQLCRQLSTTPYKPLWTSVVDWWLKKFFLIDLVRRHVVTGRWDQRIYYYTPKSEYPNLIGFLVSRMRKHHKL